MRLHQFSLFLACVLWPAVGWAQDTAEVGRIADMMVRLCVGGGHTETVGAVGSGGANLSLRSLDVTGNLKGSFTVARSNVEGLVNGIDSALSQVAADQADRVRDCLKPVRERLLDVLLPLKRQSSEGQTVPATLTLTCNVTERSIRRTGDWINGLWKNENTKSYIDTVEIDLVAKTWLSSGRLVPGRIARVSDREFVLINFTSNEDFTTDELANNFRINRITGEYRLESKSFHSKKNESSDTLITGSCQNADQDKLPF